MELKINIDTDQILGLIHQLPEDEIKRIAISLQAEMSSKKSTKSFKNLILNAPTWSDAELKRYQEARNHQNKSRLI